MVTINNIINMYIYVYYWDNNIDAGNFDIQREIF